MHSRRQLSHIASALTMLALFLAGCAAPGASNNQAPGGTPTASPKPTALPPLNAQAQEITLPGYRYSAAVALDKGFVFAGHANDGQSHPNGESFYYDYATKKVSLLDTAPPDAATGTPRNFGYSKARGNLIVYVKGTPDDRMQYWELYALNVVTRAKYALASAAKDGTPDRPLDASFDTDGRNIVYSRRLLENNQYVSKLFVFDTVTRTTRLLATDETNVFFNVSIFGSTVIYEITPPTRENGFDANFFKLNASGGTPEALFSTHGAVNMDYNGTFLTWDQITDSSAGSQGITKALDLATKKALPLDSFSCIRPRLSGHYLVCQSIGGGVSLFDLNTGAYASFTPSDTPPFVDISADRAIWYSDSKKAVEYVMLPA